MTEYVDDELPLPPFAEIFGEGLAAFKRRAKRLREGPNGDETTGRWTPEEHRLFLEGIMLYGKDWKRMQPLVKSRTLVQIRTHAQKVFKKIGLGKKAGKRGDTHGGLDEEDTAVGIEELRLLQQM
ncbi:hypothetical protein B484DRAFT_408003, partial [Ochromonadaceae sp. CCMP2298]